MPQMRSRREQVDAHKFITSRMNQALVLANPDSVERPLRRIGVSIFVSVMIMVLIFGGFAVATLFGKGNNPPEFNHIIQVKGTSSIYVYTTASGEDPTEDDPAKLWPVTNYTSALLLLKPYDGDVPVQSLKPSSLDGYPHGFMIGIDGVPSEPPPVESLLQQDNWNSCSMPLRAGSIDAHQLTQLVVEDMVEPDTWLGDEQWLLAKNAISDPETETLKYYLMWNDRKYEIPEDPTLDVLGLRKNDAVAINDNALETFPSGPPLSVTPEPYFNKESGLTDDEDQPIPYGKTVDAGGEHFVLMQGEDGEPEFAEIGEVERLLLQNLTGTTTNVDVGVKNSTGAQAQYGEGEMPQENLSDTVWQADTNRPAVCAVYDPDAQTDNQTKISIALYDSAPKTLTDAAKSVEFTTEGDIFSSVEGVDAQTVIPPGKAVLADSRTDSGATVRATSYLIDSLGFRFGLVDQGETDSTQNLLGYRGVNAVSVPDSMIRLIPQGADLDPFLARQQLVFDADEILPYDNGEQSPAAE